MSFSVIDTVFSRQLLESLSIRQNISRELQFHLDILTTKRSCSLNSDIKIRKKYNLAIKRAWEKYLESAKKNNLLQVDNQEIVKRLKQLVSDNFRPAMSECMACWFFDKKLKLPIIPKPPGKDGKILDMGVTINGQNVGIEVKAPHRPIQIGAWTGDDSDSIEEALAQSNKQFSDECPNILVIVPSLRTSMYSNRRPMITALLGEEVLEFDVDKKTGSAVSEPRAEMVPDGKFTKPIKRDHSPGYTRTSAVVVIEESMQEKTIRIFGRYFIISYILVHHVLAFHNPFAKYTISQKLFGKWPQLVREDSYMVWTDKHTF